MHRENIFVVSNNKIKYLDVLWRTYRDFVLLTIKVGLVKCK